jgi:hypothetical protein
LRGREGEHDRGKCGGEIASLDAELFFHGRVDFVL